MIKSRTKPQRNTLFIVRGCAGLMFPVSLKKIFLEETCRWVGGGLGLSWAGMPGVRVPLRWGWLDLGNCWRFVVGTVWPSWGITLVDCMVCGRGPAAAVQASMRYLLSGTHHTTCDGLSVTLRVAPASSMDFIDSLWASRVSPRSRRPEALSLTF